MSQNPLSDPVIESFKWPTIRGPGKPDNEGDSRLVSIVHEIDHPTVTKVEACLRQIHYAVIPSGRVAGTHHTSIGHQGIIHPKTIRPFIDPLPDTDLDQENCETLA